MRARTTTTIHYGWSRFNNRDIRDKYTLTLQEISETPILNDEYENFVHDHLEEAAECIPTKEKSKTKVQWETLAVRKKACRRENRFQI